MTKLSLMIKKYVMIFNQLLDKEIVVKTHDNWIMFYYQDNIIATICYVSDVFKFSVIDWEVNEKILAKLDPIIGKVSLMNLEVKGLL